MKLSERGEHGMRAQLHLEQRYGQGLSLTRPIAPAQRIPPRFLESILPRLKRAGVVTSRRGNDGGHALAMPRGEIVRRQAVRAPGGPLSAMASVAELRRVAQGNSRHRGLYAVLVDVHEAISAILDSTSLANVLRRNQES
jgi:Rrf2 family protein